MGIRNKKLKAAGSLSAPPKTTAQVRAIFGEARRRGLDNETLHELVADVLNSIGSGSRAQRRFGGGDAGSRSHSAATATAPCAVEPRTVSIAALSYTEAERVIHRLKGRSFVPRRTQQYRRAKAGVVQIVTDEQLTRIAALATQRQWSPQTLTTFCLRQCGHPVRTTADANKVIEALKAMNERDCLWVA